MDSTQTPPCPPPRAFTQGVGTVFQFAGVLLFLAFFFTCCFSGLLSRDRAVNTQLASVGWGDYTGQRALSICMVVGVAMGMSLAGIGLGLQAQRRWSSKMPVLTAGVGAVFWLLHTVFFALIAGSIVLALISLVLALTFIVLTSLSVASEREMRRSPPPPGIELLPPDYRVPYSHLHQDPPEVRLARELEQRRQRLEVQQKELEMLEQKLQDKLKQKNA